MIEQLSDIGTKRSGYGLNMFLQKKTYSKNKINVLEIRFMK